MPKVRRSLWNQFNMDDGIQLAVREKSMYEHRRRLNKIRPSIDMDTPRNFPKLQGNKMGTFTNEQYEEMQRNNKRLLQRLTNISTKESRFAKMKPPKKARRSLNQSKKRQEMDRINRENRFLVSRIMRCKPSINHKKINRDWNRHKNIVRNRTISKKKRKSYRPHRLSPISNASSSCSTPMISSRSHYPALDFNNIDMEKLEKIDMNDLRNLSQDTLQKLLISLQSNLTPIVEKSDDLKSNISSTNPSYQPPIMNNSNNIIFSPNLNNMIKNEYDQQNEYEQQTKANVNNKYDQEEKSEDEPEEVLSDWEHDEEWMQKERKIVKNRRKKAHKTVSMGLPLI